MKKVYILKAYDCQIKYTVEEQIFTSKKTAIATMHALAQYYNYNCGEDDVKINDIETELVNRLHGKTARLILTDKNFHITNVYRYNLSVMEFEVRSKVLQYL